MKKSQSVELLPLKTFLNQSELRENHFRWKISHLARPSSWRRLWWERQNNSWQIIWLENVLEIITRFSAPKMLVEQLTIKVVGSRHTMRHMSAAVLKPGKVDSRSVRTRWPLWRPKISAIDWGIGYVPRQSSLQLATQAAIHMLCGRPTRG